MTRAIDNSLATLGDAELLGRFVKTHQDAAFGLLVQRYGPMVLGVCRRVLRNSSDAEDAFQATFLLLAMRAGRIREPDLLGNWLFGVATRTAIGARRANARRVVQEQRLMRILGPRKTTTADDSDSRMTLDEQVKRLPEKLRRVVVCCYLEGLTKREAAKKLKWAEGTVTARLKEARELLRKRLGDKGLVSEQSLGAALAPVAVPAMLHATTVKSGVSIAAGKVAAGAASAKAVAMAKGTGKAIFIAKMKVAAVAVLASTMVVGAAVVQLRSANPPKAQIPAIVTTVPSALPARSANSGSLLRHAVSEIWAYANQHDGHLPPNLKAVNFSGPFQYLGNSAVTTSKIKRPSATVLLAEIPAPGSRAPMTVALADGGSVFMSSAEAEQWITESKAFFDAIRDAGSGPLPEAPGAPLPRAKIPPAKASLPPDLRAALVDIAASVNPIEVSWVRSASSPLGPEEAMSRYYVEPRFFAKWSERAALDSGRMYWRTDGTQGGTYEGAIDGVASTFTYSTATQFATQPLKSMSPVNQFGVAFLEWAGLRSIAHPADFAKPGHDSVTPLIRLLSEGAAVMSVDDTTLDGRAMKRVAVVAENDRRALHTLPVTRDYIYYFDPQLHYALRRTDERYGDRLIQRTDNEEFERLRGREVWLPRRSVRSHFTYKMVPDEFFPEPILIETLELGDVQTGPVSAERLVLKPNSGVNVINGRLINNRASAPVAGAARPPEDVLAYVKTTAPSGSYFLPGMLAIASAAVLALMAWAWRAKLRRNRR